MRDIIIAEILSLNDLNIYTSKEAKRVWINFFSLMYAPAFETIEMMHWKEYFEGDSDIMV